jgi:hypothetical protein
MTAEDKARFEKFKGAIQLFEEQGSSSAEDYNPIQKDIFEQFEKWSKLRK